MRLVGRERMLLCHFARINKREFVARRFDIEEDQWTDNDSKFRATFRLSGRGVHSQNQGPDSDALCARAKAIAVLFHTWRKGEKSARETPYAWPRVRFYRMVAFSRLIESENDGCSPISLSYAFFPHTDTPEFLRLSPSIWNYHAIIFYILIMNLLLDYM